MRDTTVPQEQDEQPTTHRTITHMSDAITRFSGSPTFLLINAVVFAVWIAANTLTPYRFDVYPFQLLTLSVSLEAIFLSLFILASQNRQAIKDRRLATQDYQHNVQSMRELDVVLTRLDAIATRLDAKGVQP